MGGGADILSAVCRPLVLLIARIDSIILAQSTNLYSVRVILQFLVAQAARLCRSAHRPAACATIKN